MRRGKTGMARTCAECGRTYGDHWGPDERCGHPRGNEQTYWTDPDIWEVPEQEEEDTIVANLNPYEANLLSSVDTIAEEVVRNRINGNHSDVRAALKALTPAKAAAVAVRAYELLPSDRDRSMFTAFLCLRSDE